jgi:valyl-tRNA synthetase
VGAHEAAISALARLSELRFVDRLPAEDAPVSITKSGKVMLHVEVDRGAECARLAKELERLDAEITSARGRLGNASFVEMAPKAVVDEMRQRLADREAKQADLRAQRAKLGC